MSQQDEPVAETNPETPSIWRLTGLWTALGIGAVLQTLVVVLLRENLTYQAFITVFITVPLTVLLLLAWWTFWSGASRQTRATGWIVVVTVFVLFVAAFRFDEFDGAMIPRFSPRWRGTGRDRAEEYLSQLPAPTSDIKIPDLQPPTESDSPAYRGANRDGVVVGVTLSPDWGQSPPKALWRHPIGLGWGSFSVIGRRAWTIEQRGADEVVACYDVETGNEIWTHSDTARYHSVQGGDGPRSTPTVDDGHVYTYGADGLLNCLDATSGQTIWSVNALQEAGGANLEWGQSCSPLIADDLVIVTPGANDKAAEAKSSGVIAYQKSTGDKVWSAVDHYGSYVSPHLAKLSGENVLLIFDGEGPLALNPKTGERLWAFGWNNRINCSQPLVVDDRAVLFSSGYGKGSTLLDVSKLDSGWQVKARWESRNFKLKFNSGVRLGDHLYGLDEGVLTCLSLKDGKRLWKQGRYGFGQMLLVDDTLLILSEEGNVVLVPATPQAPRERARFHAIDGKTWNHPTLVPGRLLVRNAEQAACYAVND